MLYRWLSRTAAKAAKAAKEQKVTLSFSMDDYGKVRLGLTMHYS